MKGRTFIVGMIAGAVLATAGSAYGASAIEKVTALVRPDYKVTVDGQAVSMQHAPLTYGGTTYVPLREAGEILGYNVSFDAGTISLDQKEESTVTEPTTPEPTSTPAPSDDPTANIDMSEWVSIKDLQDSGLTWTIGLPEGASEDTRVREYKLIFGEKSESFIIPDAFTVPYLTKNNDGVEILFKAGNVYIKKAFAEQFTAQ